MMVIISSSFLEIRSQLVKYYYSEHLSSWYIPQLRRKPFKTYFFSHFSLEITSAVFSPPYDDLDIDTEPNALVQ